MNSPIAVASPKPTRQCGDCQLCCKLLPVGGILQKPANQRCQHQRHHKGCAVYRTQLMPAECGLWVCGWLVNDDAADLSRPDRTHYVIDVMQDFVTAQNEGEPPIRIGAVQVWCDPRHPEAHRDPALRAWLDRRGQDGLVAIIRYGSSDGFTLVPPSLSGTGEWMEIKSGVETQHSIADMLNVNAVWLCAEELKPADRRD